MAGSKTWSGDLLRCLLAPPWRTITMGPLPIYPRHGKGLTAGRGWFADRVAPCGHLAKVVHFHTSEKGNFLNFELVWRKN